MKKKCMILMAGSFMATCFALTSCGGTKTHSEEGTAEEAVETAQDSTEATPMEVGNDEISLVLPAADYVATPYDDETGYGVEIENEDMYINVFRDREDDCTDLGEAMESCFHAAHIAFDMFTPEDPHAESVNGLHYSTSKVSFSKDDQYFVGYYSVTKQGDRIYYIKAFTSTDKEEMLKDFFSVRKSISYK